MCISDDEEDTAPFYSASRRTLMLEEAEEIGGFISEGAEGKNHSHPGPAPPLTRP